MIGNFGYVKSKNITEKEYKRQTMNDMGVSANTSDISNSIEITKDSLNIDSLNNFNSRKDIVEKIISDIISKEKFTVNINLENVDVDEKYLERFIIELKPRLKEIGANMEVTNNATLSDNFLEENIN